MKAHLLVFMVLLTAGCHNYSANVGEVLGCTLAGNGCGDKGLNGAPGSPGADGSSCTVQPVAASEVAPAGGALLSCTDGTNALIKNGVNGSDAVTPVIQVIKPCPNLAGSNPEVLLVLPGRQLLASVSKNQGGVETRLSIVQPGGYVTTDGRACAFSVSANSVSWHGGSVTY